MITRMLLVTLVAITAIAPQAWAGSWLIQGNAGRGVSAGDGVGLAGYNVKDKYESPTLEEDRSSTFPGVHADAGINCWVGRSWGIGITGAYHATFLDDDTFPTRVNSSFYAITGGVLIKLGRERR